MNGSLRHAKTSARRPHAAVACAALLAALLCACVESDRTPDLDTDARSPLAPSSAAMAARLRAIADWTNPEEFLYANDRRAEQARKLARRAAPGPGKFQLLVRAAQQSILAGSSEEALRVLDEATELLLAVGAPVTKNTRSTLLQLRVQANLRLGEQDNCLVNHTADSCMFPIPKGGVHSIQRGSRAAIDALVQLLEVEPDNLKYQWLLNLAYMTLGEYPAAVPERYRLAPEIFESDVDVPHFDDVAGHLGVDVQSLSGGVVLDDFNNDGRLDLVVSSWGLDHQMRFFSQRADGAFEDRTVAAGLEGQLGGLNLSHADYDNDGDADLLVLRGGWLFDQGNHPNSLLRNDGSGHFVDVTEEAGLLELVPSHTGAWGDFNNDGLLDLFVGNEPSGGERHQSRLFENQGDGRFAEVAGQVGLDVSGIVKGASWGDFDNDGLLDLYISRFGDDNLLIHNAGGDANGWRFTDVTAQAGVGEPRNSFPTWFFDYDNDGWLDIFVGSFGSFSGDSLADFASHYTGTPSTGTASRLFRNRGDGTFDDVTVKAGLDRTVLAMGANFGDLDNDGWLDIYLGTGEPTITTLVPNLMFRNDDGRGFQDVTSAGGFGNVQKGHGVAFGDIDADGDQDIYITMGGAFSGDVYPNILFENPGGPNRWLTLRFHGVDTNRDGIGARVKVVVADGDDTREIHRMVGTGGSFGSSPRQLEIGLGPSEKIDALEIQWPVSGRLVSYRDVSLDTVLLAHEERPVLLPIQSTPVRLGGERTESGHNHKE